jgi:hypothetical protein
MFRGSMFGAAIIALLIVAMIGFYWLGPSSPEDQANGLFANDCCGDVQLRDGVLSVAEISIGYTVGRDATGPFVMPERFVGTWEDRGIQIDGSRPAVKLRLDRLPAPRAIRLYDFGRSYVFRRKAPKAGALTGER